MIVETHRLGRRCNPIASRVEAIADQAAGLVQGALPGRLLPARIVIVEKRDVIDAVEAAERDMLGVRANPMKRERPQLGHTIFDSRGVVVVLNATALDRYKPIETDTTVVHELVHVAQFSRPGFREDWLEGLRNNYGLIKWSRSEARAANRAVAADEREARRYEHLARRLTVGA